MARQVTVLEVVNSAFEEIAVKTAEIALTNEELQSGITRMNDMCLEYQEAGLLPAFTEVLNGSDTLNVPRNAIACIKLQLAIRLAPAYSAPVGQLLFSNAKTALSKLRASKVDLSNFNYPSTLPRGTAQQCDSIGDDVFFPDKPQSNF